MPELDARLVSLLRQGHTEAYARLWSRHRSMALGIARRIDPYGDPEDPVSDAFASVYAIIRRGDDRITAFRPYLATTVHRQAIRHAKTRTASRLAVDFDELSLEDPGSTSLIDRLSVHETLAQLPTKYRQVLVLTLVHGLSLETVAGELGISYNATAILAMRARNRFRTLWIDASSAT